MHPEVTSDQSSGPGPAGTLLPGAPHPPSSLPSPSPTSRRSPTLLPGGHGQRRAAPANEVGGGQQKGVPHLAGSAGARRLLGKRGHRGLWLGTASRTLLSPPGVLQSGTGRASPPRGRSELGRERVAPPSQWRFCKPGRSRRGPESLPRLRCPTRPPRSTRPSPLPGFLGLLTRARSPAEAQREQTGPSLEEKFRVEMRSGEKRFQTRNFREF